MWTVTTPRAETSEASAQKQVEKTHNFRILFTLELNLFCSINCFAFADFTFGKYIFGVSTRRNTRFNKIVIIKCWNRKLFSSRLNRSE